MRRPRRKFMKQAIASCIRQKSSNSLQTSTWRSKEYDGEVYTLKEDEGCTNALTHLEMTFRDERAFRFQNSTQRHYRESEGEHASGNREALTHYIWWLVECKLVDQVLVREIKKNLKEVWKYSLQMVMEWWFFLMVEVVPTGVRTHVVATTVCVTGCVHALTCCMHIFLVYIHCAHTSLLMPVAHMHGSRVPKRFIACVSHLSISPSPFLMFHPSVLFPHGHFETTPDYDFTDDLVHTFLS